MKSYKVLVTRTEVTRFDVVVTGEVDYLRAMDLAHEKVAEMAYGKDLKRGFVIELSGGERLVVSKGSVDPAEHKCYLTYNDQDPRRCITCKHCQGPIRTGYALWCPVEQLAFTEKAGKEHMLCPDHQNWEAK